MPLKKHLLLIIYLFVTIALITPATAQDIKQSTEVSANVCHIVAKGETWELIAFRYEISEETLRLLNPLVTSLHTGIKLTVPSSSYAPLYSDGIKNRVISIRLHTEALKAIQDNNYSRAVKLCNQAIKHHPSIQVYLTRGMAHAGLHKWRQASDDYLAAMGKCDDDEISASIKPLYDDAIERHEAWLDSRLSFWNSVGAAALQVGAQALDTYLAAEYNQAYPNPFFNYSTGATNGSALYMQMPSSLDFRNYVINEPLFEYHYDEYGNMYSTANGLANTLQRMNADFNRDIYTMTSQLAMNGQYESASSIIMQLQTNNLTSKITEDYFRMPVYGFSESATNTTEKDLSSYSLQDEYDAYARIAEIWGKSIESNGVGYNDSNDRHHSEMNVSSGTPSAGNASIVMRQGLRNAQKEMSRIRREALGNGIEIKQSIWETTSTAIY